MELKTIRTDAVKKIKEIEKAKTILVALVTKLDEIKALPKDKKEKAIMKLETWFDAKEIDTLLGN